jgi:hypothetical protein
MEEVSVQLHVAAPVPLGVDSTILVRRMGRFIADLDMVTKIKHRTGSRTPVCDSFSSLMK